MTISHLYASLFSRKSFYKINKFLFNLSLKGLGVGNYYNSHLSGEDFVMKHFLTKKNIVVFDIGANEGNWNLELLSINNNVQIFAFEPSPKTFSILSSNLNKHNNVKLYNCGIGSTNGKLTLYDYGDSDGSEHASLFKEVMTEQHNSASIIEHIVDIITIDSFINENHISSVYFLKIDTEGYEMQCLLGAKDSLAKGIIKIIQFEFNTMNVSSKVFFKDFYDLLSEQYKLFRLIQNGLIPIEKYDPMLCEIYGFQNILAIHKNHLS